jgi:iron-sulfur cluster insertion protein
MESSRSISLDTEALAKALELKTEFRQYQGKELRLYLEGKGCDGFYYGVAFDHPQDNDLKFTHDGIDVLIDPDSYEFCAGSTISWVDDERGQGFLVNNPNHRKFRGKFYKRRHWQDKLQAKKAETETSHSS